MCVCILISQHSELLTILFSTHTHMYTHAHMYTHSPDNTEYVRILNCIKWHIQYIIDLVLVVELSLLNWLYSWQLDVHVIIIMIVFVLNFYI